MNFEPGDVIWYTPAESWCREGTAIVSDTDGTMRAHDTYWGSSGDRHLLTEAELETAELRFKIGDYEELAGNSRHMNEARWNSFAKADRQVITSQKGLQRRLFVRKGAEPSWDQQIQNAREELDKAIREADSAVRNVGYRHAEVTLLIYRAAEAAKTQRPTTEEVNQ